MRPVEEPERALAETLGRFPEVAAAWLFGSVARGEAHPGSDVDIGLVLRDRRLTAASSHVLLRRIAAALEHHAGGRPVDIVLLESQGPIFCHKVLEEGKLIYEADAERRVDFVSETCVRYFDFLPTYELASSAALDAVDRALRMHE